MISIIKSVKYENNNSYYGHRTIAVLTGYEAVKYIEYDYLGAPGGISIEKLLIMVSHGVAGGLPSRKTDDTNIE